MADNENPFGDDDDRTVFVPSPSGGRRRPRDAKPAAEPEPPSDDRTVFSKPEPGRDDRTVYSEQAPARPRPRPAPSQPREETAHAGALRATGLNPVVDAALPLLSLGGQLRHTAAPQDIRVLRKQIGQTIQKFEADVRSRGVGREAAMVARYAICTFIDEMVLSTPWGSESGWSQSSMLSTFHKETWGGEKFFTLIERLLTDPAGNLHLLELLYVCMCLGFEGKYRVLERGHAQLERVEESVYAAIVAQRGEFERELSPHWRGLEDRRSALTRYVPLWVVAAFAATVLLALYVTFAFTLAQKTDPLFARIMRIGAGPAPMVQAPPPPPTKRSEGLRTFLKPEIEQGLVEVIEYNDRTVIRIKGDGLFASGSAVPKPAVLPLIKRIAEAIVSEPGTVLVTGHTDNVPIRTLAFPSNWHLSQARADAVAKLLASDMPPAHKKKIVAEGRADSEPLVPNDTVEHRARNRRVEIILRGRGIGGVATATGNS